MAVCTPMSHNDMAELEATTTSPSALSSGSMMMMPSMGGRLHPQLKSEEALDAHMASAQQAFKAVDIVNGSSTAAWTPHETKDLIAIRALLDPHFSRTKRNKPLWDLVASRMKDERGHAKTPVQCKLKWKSLCNRYSKVVLGPLML